MQSCQSFFGGFEKRYGIARNDGGEGIRIVNKKATRRRLFVRFLYPMLVDGGSNGVDVEVIGRDSPAIGIFVGRDVGIM